MVCSLGSHGPASEGRKFSLLRNTVSNPASLQFVAAVACNGMLSTEAAGLTAVEDLLVLGSTAIGNDFSPGGHRTGFHLRLHRSRYSALEAILPLL
jgi:hypothetical protein